MSSILQFAIITSKPPAPVALEGRLCQSAKPHEYKRSLVWLNLPYPTNWEEPKVRRPPLSISILQRRQGTPPSNLPPPIKFLLSMEKFLLFLLLCPSMEVGVVSCFLAAI